MTPEQTLPKTTGLGRTALTVTDLDRVATFYDEVVGLTLNDRTEERAILGAGGSPLLILEGTTPSSESDNSTCGLYHNAFRVPSRDHLGAALARIRDRWHLDGASDHGVSEALYLRDPAGNGIEIYRDRPRSDWPYRKDGTVALTTDPLDLSALQAAANDETTLPAGTDLGHVHLAVSELSATREFYVDTVGFAVETEMPSALFVAAGGYHHHLGANTWEQRTNPRAGPGLSWFEIVLPDDAGLNGVRQRFEGGGYRIDELEEGFSVQDPDAIEVRFRVS